MTTPAPTTPPKRVTAPAKMPVKAPPGPLAPAIPTSQYNDLPGAIRAQEMLKKLADMKPFQSATVPGLFPGLCSEEVVLFLESKTTDDEGATVNKFQVSFFSVRVADYYLRVPKKGPMTWTP